MSDWTLESLKELFELLLKAHETQDGERHVVERQALRDAIEAQRVVTATAFEAAQIANAKTERAIEKRFDAANEFRAQLAAQANTFIPRLEAQLLIDGLGEKFNAVSKHQLEQVDRFVARPTYETGHADLAHRIEATVADIAAMRIAMATGIANAAGSAETQARNARTFGLLIGAGGVVVAIAAVIVSRL